MPGEQTVPQPGNAPNARQESDQVQAPAISLPKGGGAIRGMGEKFASNPVTGTGSMTVPIATSPGRAGFGPQLSLSYDSGSGNGPFGFGWSLGLPHLTRKTDKRLPQYNDASESDVFLLSGAEDLVPVLNADTSRFEDRTTEPGYLIHRYRPRIEGLFARIERWTRLSDADVHWRSLSKDNVLTIYGKDTGSRITDPADAKRIFTWLICETRDDKGNVVLYDYKPDDGEGIDLAMAHEHNRGAPDDPRRMVTRYIKRIRYGNRTPLLDASGQRPRFLTDPQIQSATWMFEAVFDYGEHDLSAPHPTEIAPWMYRTDAFSTYRSGFEARTGRRCRRVLMFHHFEQEADVGNDCLVRSTDFTYADELSPPDLRYPIHSFIRSVTQCGYRRQGDGYLQRSLPPVEFEYSVPVVQGTVQDVDAVSLENLPAGLDGEAYQWTDLHGEGIPGILTEQAGAWYYKRNLSPVSERVVEFAAIERVASKPNFSLAGGQAQLMDLAGDGQLDLVVREGPTPGFHEHDGEEGWGPFRPFTARLNRDTRDPNLRFIDLDGDGLADALITEDEAFVWHASLAEEGFGPARRVQQELDEETGPRLVFSDPTQSIYLADMTGDGLTDLVRIRNGEVCYWPNLGYGRFGAKVTMDQAPHFDRPDRFDQRRIRLADIDGSGANDVIYLSGDGVTLYFNQSGNSWSAGQRVAAFPAVDNVAVIQAADLMGNGTACLVWSSPLPGHATRSMRYVDLMGGQKPHLLVRSVNNLGAETVVHYATSTKFYLADKLAGKSWITKLPFPVHVVERVETFDRISGNRFVARYAYHHGYFDGAEREFRGFGMVEQFDTEEFAALSESAAFPIGTNINESSHVPPVLTRTWFHTGIYLGRHSVSNYFAGLVDDQDSGEYYREPGLTDADAEAGALLLDDTVLPPGLSLEEECEACRALKGAMLRQEVYALDGTEKEAHPYVVTEQNFTIRLLQPQAENRHAVFFTHAREAITFQYERNPTDPLIPADPRVSQTLTLEVDDFGNVLKSAAVGYGRRQADPALSSADQARQAERLVTCSENAFTNSVDSIDAYHTPLPSESRAYELAGLDLEPEETRLGFDQVLSAVASATPLAYEETLTANLVQKRLIEHVRTQFRPNDLGAAQGDPLALLPLGQLESLALPGESYKLALTPGLVAQRFSGKVSDSMLETEGRYVHSQGDANWWLRSGRVFLSPGTNDDPAVELAYARQHFFLPHRFRDPFHRTGFETESVVTYDAYDLAIRETRDALGNVATAVHDYRLLQPRLMTDPNGNRAEVAFDALGMVVGTAVMGKTSETKGDSLFGFSTDLDEATALAHLGDPFADPQAILQRASTRMMYDLFAYLRTRNEAQPQSAVVYTLARETHDADLQIGEQTRIQHSFSYSDGFGREIQKKIQAEPGPLIPGNADISPRWVGTGWTVFNNKGKPVRQYEPFFTDTHQFEFAILVGVSPIVCYDPVQRVVATLNPNHTWQKVLFDPWRQESWNVNDTVLITNPADDLNVGDFFSRLPADEYLPTWHGARIGGALGVQEQAAARKTESHANTPAVAHMDSLGRTFLTVAYNRVTRGNGPTVDQFYRTRVIYDIEGNQRDVIDAKDRVVMRYDYDMLSNPIHSVSMDAGERWMVTDVAGQPMRAWDARGHEFRTEYDQLHRPINQFVRGTDANESDPRVLNRDVLFVKVEYGEGQTNDVALNLRTRAYRSYDNTGVVTSEEHDFKGNLLRGNRQLAVDYKGVPDWAGTVGLEPQVFSSSTTYDALNRPTSVLSPDNSEITPTYNEANLLEQVQARLRGTAEWTTFVEDIDYNAKGQREILQYGNGVVTTYDYDPLTFRLVNLKTTRSTDGDLQNLSYTFDPAGNLTYIKDAAQQTIYFANTQITPDADYTYDAINQLIKATGREHIGQAGQVDHNDPPIHPLPHPNDSEAMRPYTEQYEYDAVGNILAMIHQANSGSWTRRYQYASDSNRLLATSLPGDDPEGPYTGKYQYNLHGSMTAMSHLPLMIWDFAERMRMSTRQVVNDGTPETTYYVYDASGQRVRKVTEHQAAANQTPTRMKERIYIGGFEIYREYDNPSTGSGQAISLERETLHVMDDKQRVALVETRTQGDDGSPGQLVLYQLGNHLSSASLELDEAGEIISYEEYYPYGSTSYQTVDASIRTAAKRYRSTGKERDEETGLYYHGARYYAPWLGRWCSVDPLAAQTSGQSTYASFANNPSNFVDPDGRSPWSEFVDAMNQRMAGIEERTVEGDPFTLGQDLAVYEIIDSVNTFASMTYEDWANVLETVQRLGPGKLIEASLTKTVEEAAPAFLSNDPYERDIARGKLLQSGLIAVSAELAGTAPGLAVTRPRPSTFLPDPPDVGGARVSGTTGTAITWSQPDTDFVGTIRPIENEFIDELVPKAIGKPESIYRAEPYAEEIIVPIPRAGTNDIGYMLSDARRIATERNAPVVSFGRLERFPEASKVTFFGHSNPYVLGRKTADDLHNRVVTAGLSPETYELAGCSTLAPVGCIGSIGAWALGLKPLAPRLHSLSGATILGYRRAVYTNDIIGGVDQVRFPR